MDLLLPSLILWGPGERQSDSRLKLRTKVTGLGRDPLSGGEGNLSDRRVVGGLVGNKEGSDGEGGN